MSFLYGFVYRFKKKERVVESINIVENYAD